MRLSREKILRLSHLILNHLDQDDGVEYFADPQEDLAAVMMIQLTNGGLIVPMIPAFETAIYQAIVE